MVDVVQVWNQYKAQYATINSWGSTQNQMAVISNYWKKYDKNICFLRKDKQS